MEGYQEMGRKGGLSTTEEFGEERVQREGIPVDESKFTRLNNWSTVISDLLALWK